MKKIRIKALFTLAALLFLNIGVTAQQADSTAVHFEQDSIAQYLTPLEYAFMMHEQTRFMLRLPAIGLGAEVEILPYISLMAEAVYGNGWSDEIYSELRWHYGARRLNSRSMSGNYVAAGFSQHFGFNSYFYGRWGMQRRFLTNGLLDMGINARIITRDFENNPIDGIFQLVSVSSLGLGFVFNKSKGIDRDRICPVVKCYDVEKFLLKINLNNIGSISYQPSTGFLGGLFAPSIAVEKKLFNSSFSINLNSSFGFILSTSDNTINSEREYSVSPYAIEFIGEGRWYYNMFGRMKKGKGGNGLSANYFALGVRQQRVRVDRDNYNFRGGFILSTGVQRTIGKRFYFDIQGGVTEGHYWGNDRDFVEYILDVRAGIKF